MRRGKLKNREIKTKKEVNGRCRNKDDEVMTGKTTTKKNVKMSLKVSVVGGV